MRNDRLLLFTRYPTPGSTKTRLIPRLGPEGAADLQEWLTGHSVLAGTLWANRSGGSLDIYTTGAPESAFRSWLGREHCFLPQQDGDLGERLQSAATAAFASGAERVCMIGIDCPSLGPAQIQEAFDALHHHDVSIIPASDGGYVLLGFNSLQADLFREIPWGTGTVCETTRKRAIEAGLTLWTGTPLDDVDVPDDLHHLPTWRATPKGLSVIIPAYNEEEHISNSIESALDGSREVIVVDGGSRDQTVPQAEAAGATVITGVKGRGPQQNLGAWHAKGDSLLFLHADCRLPKGYAQEVEKVLSRQGTGLGAFSLQIAGKHPGLRWVEWAVNLRSRVRKRPYGDQSLFIRRDLFERLGGFPGYPLLEDLEFVLQVSRRRQVAISPLRNACSPRRWDTRGIVATTLRNQQILLAYSLGVSPATLAAWYHGGKRETV